jgi:hypothetical protein
MSFYQYSFRFFISVVESATTNHFNFTSSSNRQSIRITEYFDSSSSSDDDRMDMQSIVLTYTSDKMDDND